MSNETLPKYSDLPSTYPSKSQKEQQIWHLPGSLFIFNYKPLFGLMGWVGSLAGSFRAQSGRRLQAGAPTRVPLNQLAGPPLYHARRLLFHRPYQNRHLHATCRLPDQLTATSANNCLLLGS